MTTPQPTPTEYDRLAQLIKGEADRLGAFVSADLRHSADLIADPETPESFRAFLANAASEYLDGRRRYNAALSKGAPADAADAAAADARAAYNILTTAGRLGRKNK